MAELGVRVFDGQITPHFNIKEMANRGSDYEVLLNAATIAHAERLEKLRVYYNKPMSVNSWYRTPAYNAKIGGATDSKHLLGIATDIHMPVEDRTEAKYRELEAKWRAICKAEGLEGGVGFYDTFIHFDSRKEYGFWDEREAQPQKTNHYKVGYTDVIELSPMQLKIAIIDSAPAKVGYSNFVNGGYIWWQKDGQSYSLGILVSEGKVLSNRQPHNKPAGTFIIYKDGTVAQKEILDITKEQNVWFAISGCGILPAINMVSGGFTGVFADIKEARNRPMIGYRKRDNKIIIAVRPNTTIERGRQTLINLGCDFGITLDAGTSTALKIDGDLLYNTTRRLHNIIIW